MNKIELYTYLCYVSFALCILCLVVAAVLFFYYDMRSVIGYLTGRSAKKKIQELEEETAASAKLPHKTAVSEKQKKETETEQVSVTEPCADETEALNETEEMKKIVSVEKDFDETTALRQITFVIKRELLVIHTDETI